MPNFLQNQLPIACLLLMYAAILKAEQAPPIFQYQPDTKLVISSARLSLKDTEHSPSTGDASRLTAETTQTTIPLRFGVIEKPFQLAFRVNNPTALPQTVVLQIQDPSLDEVRVRHKQGTLWQQIQFGDSVPRSPDMLRSEGFAFTTTLQPGLSDFALDIKNSGFSFAPMVFYSQTAFHARNDLRARIAGMFAGIALGMLFFNFGLWLQTREKSYGVLSLLILTGLIQQPYYQGTAQSYFPELIYWNDKAPYFLSLLYLSATLWFHSSFLRLKEKARGLYWITIGWASFYAGLSLIWLSTGLGGSLFYTFTLVPIYISVSTCHQAFRGDRPAKIYLIATLIPMGIVFYGFLRFMAGSPGTEAQLFIENSAGAVALFLFSIALADKIHSLRKANKEAQHRAAESEALVAAKSQFLAKMSHEIRTPLNGMIGMSELLMQTNLSKEQQHLGEIIQGSGQNLLVIVNDILDFSKAEAGELQLEQIPVDIHDLVNRAGNVFTSQTQTRNILLTVHIDSAVPKYVVGDPTRIQQILQNLISNAIKFTGHGSVFVSLTLDVEKRLHFSVADSGVGIPEDKQASLFKAFSQVHTSTTREYGGSGLGLAICKQLTALMHGEIGFSSQEGYGSTFWFTLPLPFTKAAPETNNSMLEHVELSLRILVVEDNEVNQKVISGMLKKLRHSFQVADHGKQAIEIIQTQHNDFDVILMDCEMPVMDGFEAAQEIRSFEANTGATNIPIIAVTAHAVLDIVQRCQEAGMSQHLAKPIQLASLRQAIAEASQSLEATDWQLSPAKAGS
ncbi:MAG: ATP-binding protein [Pseudomonadales bacterium]